VSAPASPDFDEAFRERLATLVAWRRDVRRFRRDPIARETVMRLLRLAAISPSVGNSQPWRFVLVESPELRSAVTAEVTRANEAAAEIYADERAALYRRLKLEGLADAPVHLAVFCDDDCEAGARLGRLTMPETLRYSVVGAIHALWLLARAEGLGIGWVSILDPVRVAALLEAPKSWTLIGYLCIGRPVEEHDDPELSRAGWQERHAIEDLVFTR
jgi:5,6-dimethylbenzimidazole synthase